MDQPTALADAPAALTAHHPGGIKETIESILIAFILAFIFRAFVVEAFVIPTGSMAPTLLGAHVRYTCQDCGWVYDVNVSSPASQTTDDPQVPSFVKGDYESICPNCAYINVLVNAPVRYGDRILVLKYLDVLRDFGLIQNPRRWDVVVFKTPFKKPYQQNYIKRLVGLPGDSLLILDGDIYAAQNHSTDITQFKIQRKTSEAQEALWQIVYDNDHLPQRLTTNRPPGLADDAWSQPWKVLRGEGWKFDGQAQPGRVFTFDGQNQSGTLYFDRDANRPKNPSLGNSPLTDWLAYDVSEGSYRASSRPYVSDLKLDLYYKRQSGDGPLELKLTKRDDLFVAQILPDRVRLLKRSRESEPDQVLSEKMMNLPTGSAVHLQFINHDYHVQLKVAGETVLATTAEQYAPNPAELLREYQTGDRSPAPAVEISAANQTATVEHLSLWRDIYYINGGDHRIIWASPDQFPNSIIHLGPTDYFVLGDNSPISWDARYWAEPINLPAEDLQVEAGRVPARFMLGKAFFVYWPAGYPVLTNGPSLAPNFGEMRFIH